jgi:hypothetical protein
MTAGHANGHHHTPRSSRDQMSRYHAARPWRTWARSSTAEQLTLNQFVGGSNPPGLTKFIGRGTKDGGMTAGQQSALISPRGIALHLVAVLLAIVALSACQSAAESPIVYTAPPEVLAARTFAPVASPSAAPSVGPSGATASANVGHPARGGIVFWTAVGTDSCSVTNPTDVLLSTQPFFFAAYLTDQQDGSTSIVLHIEKDGVTLVDHQEPADGTAYDCYGNTSSLGTLRAGAYEFTVLQGTKVEADGSVTVR